MRTKSDEYILYLYNYINAPSKSNYMLECQLIDRLDDLWYNMAEEERLIVDKWKAEHKDILGDL